MTRLPVLLVALMATAACSAETATQEPDRSAEVRIDQVDPQSASPAVVPENPDDRRVRRNLNHAISQDIDLKDREISFIVSNGDVNVTGTVKSEAERKKINDLAMSIDGVRSVANALRVLP